MGKGIPAPAMNPPDSFEEMLCQAFAADPRVLVDARRLRRFWKPGGSPPVHWTFRWAPGAVDCFFAWAGIDVIRSLATGSHRADVSRLFEKMGRPAALREDLDRFLKFHEPARFPADGLTRRSLLEKKWSSNTRRWIEHALSGGGALTETEAFEMAAVARALDLLFLQKGRWHVSVLGARAGVASKFFRAGAPGRRRLADALLFLKGRSDFSDPSRETILDEAGVMGSDTAYGVLTAGGMTLDGLDYPSRLAEKNQAIYLSLQNLVHPRLAPGVEGILTIENEAPFLGAMAEGLHRRWLLLATGGFPNRAVVRLLKSVLPLGGTWLHWGDTDLAGVRIARTLADRVGAVPVFFRCAGEDVRRWRDRLISLNPSQSKCIASDLRACPEALGADVLRTVLQEGGWLEQEAWQAPA